jgi:hypothetical protein
MPTPQILLTYTNKNEIESRSRVFVEPRINKLFGIKVRLDLPDLARVGAQMDKSKKPAEWLLSFKNPKIVVDLRVGSDLHRLAEVDLRAEKDPAGWRDVIEAMRENGVINSAEAAALHKAHPDPAVVKQLAGQINSKKKEFDDLVRQASAAKKELDRLNKELVEQGG